MTSAPQESARHYLGPKLDPSALAALGDLDLKHPGVRAALLRMLRKLAVSRQPATVFTRYFVEQLAEQVAAAYGGVPPLLLPLRFDRLDRWILGYLGRRQSSLPIHLADIYPASEVPQSARSAERFPQLQVSTLIAAGSIPPSMKPLDLVRCMNVLPTLAAQERADLVEWLEATLLPNGHAILGVHAVAGTEARYRILIKVEKRLMAVAFAFSIDCVLPVGPRPFLEIERDPDSSRLMRLVRLIREDKKFTDAFDARFDHLLLKHGLLAKTPRSSAILPHPLALAERAQALAQVLLLLDEEGWVDRAAGILASAGLPAFRNECGDVAVRLTA